MSTKIEWTRGDDGSPGETWNPVTGCSKVSQGCHFCYAERLWPKVEGSRVKREGGAPRSFTDIRCHPERLDAPLHWRTPRRIFVNSMSDLFHEDVPDAFLDQVFTVMCKARQHTFQVLTKRAARMHSYMYRFKPDGEGWITRDGQRAMGEPGIGPLFADNRWPVPQIWLGVSVEDQDTADERIPLLLETPAAIRFVSYEPALGPLRLDRFVEFETDNNGPILPGINWLIAGGESGPNARPSHPDWFRSARDQCAEAGVAYFFKQWGEWSFGYGGIPAKARSVLIPGTHGGGNFCKMWLTGKKIAGRLLDGREHNEYPA